MNSVGIPSHPTERLVELVLRAKIFTGGRLGTAKFKYKFIFISRSYVWATDLRRGQDAMQNDLDRISLVNKGFIMWYNEHHFLMQNSGSSRIGKKALSPPLR